MAQTVGFVQKVSFLSSGTTRGGCAWVGPSPSNVEQFTLLTYDTDQPNVLENKIAMMESLTTALASRLPVTIDHPDASGVITSIVLSQSGS